MRRWMILLVFTWGAQAAAPADVPAYVQFVEGHWDSHWIRGQERQRIAAHAEAAFVRCVAAGGTASGCHRRVVDSLIEMFGPSRAGGSADAPLALATLR